MVLHGENLKQYLSLGMKLKKVRKGLFFKQKPFMKIYIDKKYETQNVGKKCV